MKYAYRKFTGTSSVRRVRTPKETGYEILMQHTCTYNIVHFLRLLAVCWPGAKVHETITFLLVTLPNIHRFLKCFTHRLSNKPFLIGLLTTPPHLKYVATLRCNLS